MSNPAVSILVAIGLAANCGGTLNMTVNIGVEQSTYTGVLRTRQDGKKVVYLKENEHIQKNFEIFSYCLFSTASVIYSNDGGSDSTNVTLDGVTVGFFTTQPPSTDDLPSELWNIQQESGPLGGSVFVELQPGSHFVALSVTRTDCNGLEIVDVTLHLACENSPTFSASSTAPSTSVDFPHTNSPPFFATANGIVSISFIVLIGILILICIPGLICWCMYYFCCPT